MHIINIIQVSLVEFKKKKCWINCVKLTQLSVFVVFWEPFANTFLLERNKLFFFDPQNQQSSKFCPVEQSWSSVLLYHSLELSWWLQKSILLVELLFQWGKIMYLNLSSANLSIICRKLKLSIFAIFCWFSSKSKKIDSLIMHFRVKNKMNDLSHAFRYWINKVPYTSLMNSTKVIEHCFTV